MTEREIDRYLRHIQTPWWVPLIFSAVLPWLLLIPDFPIVLGTILIIVFEVALIVGAVYLKAHNRSMSECMHTGHVVPGIVIDISQNTGVDRRSQTTWQALVEVHYDGDVKEIWSESKQVRTFEIGDTLDVYLHPTNPNIAHVVILPRRFRRDT
jgi:hypothetical protein